MHIHIHKLIGIPSLSYPELDNGGSSTLRENLLCKCSCSSTVIFCTFQCITALKRLWFWWCFSATKSQVIREIFFSQTICICDLLPIHCRSWTWDDQLPYKHFGFTESDLSLLFLACVPKLINWPPFLFGERQGVCISSRN